MQFLAKILCLLISFFVLVSTESADAQTGKLHGKPDAVISGEELWPPAGPFLLTRLAGRVAGIAVHPGRDIFEPPQIRIRGQAREPLYILDGMFTNVWMVNSVHPEDVDRIEILKNVSSLSIYGGRASGGVVAVYTKIYEDDEEPLSLGMLDTDIFSPYLTYKQSPKPKDTSLLARIAQAVRSCTIR